MTSNSDPVRNTNAKTFTISQTSLRAPDLEAGLYIVSTPIGHLKDMTLRALETLASANMIACEDTRVTRVLLNHYGIQTPLISYNEHNSEGATAKILHALETGSVALVSDAGTPLVSDPGLRLVPSVLAAGYKVFPIPGASAVLAALVAAGLGDAQFYFAGFLPTKSKARADTLQKLRDIDATLVFYESPNRIAATLRAACDVYGPERAAAVCREITKRFETHYRGTLGELADEFEALPRPKGEIVLLIERGSDDAVEFDVDAALHNALESMSVKQAVAEVTNISGLPRRDIYQRALQLKNEK